ncbi:NB-ARC domain-containing protein [Phormidesmis sp. 146-35]
MNDVSNKLAESLGVNVQGGIVSIDNVNVSVYQLYPSLTTNISQDSVNSSDIRKTCDVPPEWIRQRLQKNISDDFFVHRPQELGEVVKNLLKEQKEQSEDVIALWGPAGCGKTTLALLACCLPEVLSHFGDNIFWIDLEEEKDTIEGMKTLHQQSIGSDLTGFTSDDIATTLVKKWKDEPRLIVLDNLQMYEDLRILLSCRDRNCTWLITTRNKRSFAGKASTKTIQIDPLRIDESVLLLYYRLKQADEIDFEILKILVNQLYEFPLLIELIRQEINIRIGLKHTPNAAIESILEDIQENGWNFCEDITRKLSRNFENSMKHLAEEEKKHLREMVIFPEDISIPISTLAKLWCLSEKQAMELCEKFYGSSLLKKYNSTRKIVCTNNILREHFLQQDESKAKSSEVHKRLLSSHDFPSEENVLDSTFDNLPNEDKIYWGRFYEYHYKRAFSNH